MRETLLSLLLVLGLVACGEDKPEATTAGSGGGGKTGAATLEPAPTQEVGPGAAALVPADSHAVLCIRSLRAAEALMNEVSQVIGEPLPMDPMQSPAMIGVDPKLVDGGRQLLAAFKMAQGMPRPSMTFVLPVTDMDKAAAGGGGFNKAQQDGYLGMSTVQGYAAGAGCKLLDGMPDGDIVLRLDLGALTKLYGAAIQGELDGWERSLNSLLGGEMPGADAASMAAKIFGFARDIVGSAERLDVVASAKGGVYDVDLAYTAKAGSALAKAGESSALDGLAKYVPTDFPVTVLFQFDPNTLLEWTDATIDMAKQTMAPELRESYGNFMKKSEELWKYVGKDWLMSAKVGKEGLSLVMAVSSPDPAAYIAKYLEFIKDPVLADIGMTLKVEGEREVAGAKVQRIRVTIDGEKFGATAGLPAGEVDMFVALVFGTGGINLDLAAVGGRLVMVVGREDSLTAAVLGASEAPPALRQARAEARGDLGFLVHVDARGLAKGIAALAGKIGHAAPAVPDGPPAPFTFYGSRENRTYRCGLHVDVKQVKSVVDALH